MSQRTADTRKNFDLVKNIYKNHYHIKRVHDVIYIDSESDSGYDEDDEYIPRMVKIEDSDSRYDRSKVDPEKNQYDALIEDVNK